jgi:carboxylesterase
MQIERIPKETRPVSIALPIRLEAPGDTAVLALQGFRGITGNISYLVHRLHENGYAVYAPRLPGHGTNFADFSLTGWKDWLRCSIDSYLELRASYRRVYVTGLSMGGLLSLILASRFDIEKIALCAPALKAKSRLLPFTPLLRYVLPTIPSKYEEKSEDPERNYLAKEYWSIHSSYAASQLYRLQRMTRRCLTKVKAETLTIVSKADETVPPEVADIIEGSISSSKKHRIVLEESPHVITEGVERERVAMEVIKWFNGEAGSPP